MTMMVHGDERPTRARGGDFFAENAPVLDTIEFIEFTMRRSFQNGGDSMYKSSILSLGFSPFTPHSNSN
jgi:hypothetical protein